MLKDLQVKEAMRRMVNPLWDNPNKWMWNWQGGRRGIAALRIHPGKFNLTWLALNLQEPPEEYTIRNNDLALWVLFKASEAVLQFASVHTLEEFSMYPDHSSTSINLLTQLARERLWISNKP